MLKKPEFEETVKFNDMFDKWFDCLNVFNPNVGKLKRNPFKSPYCNKLNFRLTVNECVSNLCHIHFQKWLRETFISSISEELGKGFMWAQAIQ